MPQTPYGGSAEEEIAYRAGILHSRISALESHAAIVNGSIKATGDALGALTMSVNELRLTIKMLELHELAARVTELEKVESSVKNVAAYQRWLVTAGLAALATLVALVVDLTHLI